MTLGGSILWVLDCVILLLITFSLYSNSKQLSVGLNGGLRLIIAGWIVIVFHFGSGWLLQSISGLHQTMLHTAFLLTLCAVPNSRERLIKNLKKIRIRINFKATNIRRVQIIPIALTAALLVLSLVFAVINFPTIADSHAYRLSRIGQWLQEGHFGFFEANDERLHYMPFYADILMAWGASFFPTGYALSAIPQFLGGLLLLTAVSEFCRILKIGDLNKWIAIATCLMMPNVLLQFATSQTDLITAGLFNLGIVYLWRFIESESLLTASAATISFGLALGSKSTIVYWGPGIILWLAIVLLARRRLELSFFCKLAVIALIAVIIGSPTYVRNTIDYGNPFAPQEHIERIHMDIGILSIPGNATFIAGQHAWQILQKQSNPWPIEGALHQLSKPLKTLLDERPPNEEFATSFKRIAGLLDANHTYVDIVTFGSIPVLFVFLSIFPIMLIKSQTRPQAASMLVALLVFFAFFFTQQTPNAWNFRFFILQAPFISVLCLWTIQSLGKYQIWLSWLVLSLSSINAYETLKNDVLGSFKSFSNPGANASILIHGEMESMLYKLKDSERVGIALPPNSMLSPFFRTRSKAEIVLLKPEELPNAGEQLDIWLSEKGIDGLIVKKGALAAAGFKWKHFSQNSIFPAQYQVDAYSPLVE